MRARPRRIGGRLAPGAKADIAIIGLTRPLLQDIKYHGGVKKMATNFHAPTFQLFDRCYRPEPITVDYIFVSEGLKDRVQRVEVDLTTRASDHQPVLIELA